MSKFRKDGALDERYKGAKETNQTGFFGIILGLLFFSRRNKNLEEAGKKMHQAQQNMEKNIKAKAKADPEYAKNFAKAKSKYDKLF